MKKYLLIIILLASTFLTLNWLLSDLALCDNEFIQSTTSPDNKWKVVLFQRDCGATTNFSSHIVVIKREQKFDPEQNIGKIFIADGTPTNFQIRWVDKRHLLVKAPQTRVYKVLKSYQNIDIQYTLE